MGCEIHDGEDDDNRRVQFLICLPPCLLTSVRDGFLLVDATPPACPPATPLESRLLRLQRDRWPSSSPRLWVDVFDAETMLMDEDEDAGGVGFLVLEMWVPRFGFLLSHHAVDILPSFQPPIRRRCLVVPSPLLPEGGEHDTETVSWHRMTTLRARLVELDVVLSLGFWELVDAGAHVGLRSALSCFDDADLVLLELILFSSVVRGIWLSWEFGLCIGLRVSLV
ncbi:hypothetical protein Dimus_010670 [Dionaea muscipula]